MKSFIVVLLIFLSLSDGRDFLEPNSTNSTVTTTLTTTTVSTTTATNTTATTTSATTSTTLNTTTVSSTTTTSNTPTTTTMNTTETTTTTTTPTTPTTTTMNTTETTTTTTTPTTPTTTIMNTTESTTTTVTTSVVSTSTTTTPLPTATVTVNVTWIFTSGIDTTNVLMTVGNLKTTQYAAIGLGQNQAMGEAHVFICKRHSDDKVTVERYVNLRGHVDPQSAGSEQGGVMTPLPSKSIDGVITCQFNLSNFTTSTVKQLNVLRPLSQSGSYYPLFAIGLLDSDGEPTQHDSKVAQSNQVQLNKNEIILYRIAPGPAPVNPLKYIQAHGIIMVITWIFIVSTGILISRYFKKSWAKKFLCGKPVWFTAHRLLMSLAAVLTILGFLFILVAFKGTWATPQDERKHYIHTLTGVLVISFAFFQPFIALFRCEPDSRYRFIFNYLHAFVGFVAFILSIATLFLATYFKIFKDNKGRIIMTVWSIWIVFIFITFEFIQHYFGKERRHSTYFKINSSTRTIEELTENPISPSHTSSDIINEQEPTNEDKIKNILLAIHVFVAALLAIILSTLIA